MNTKELREKAGKCGGLQEKLYQIEDVVKPINEQLPGDIVIRQIMLILNNCSNLTSSRYKRALDEIEIICKAKDGEE